MQTNSWIAWHGKDGFNSDYVKFIIEEGEKQQPEAAVLKDQDGSDKKSKIRRSKVSWVNHLPQLRQDLFSFVLEANRSSFGFDVQNAADMQFTEYHASVKGHYDWHEDWFPFSGSPYQRKLSITVQLSNPDEYEGGDFEIYRTEMPDWIKDKGTILVFPSFLKHRVKPVTKGVRRSLVAWFEGPSWR